VVGAVVDVVVAMVPAAVVAAPVVADLAEAVIAAAVMTFETVMLMADVARRVVAAVAGLRDGRGGQRRDRDDRQRCFREPRLHWRSPFSTGIGQGTMVGFRRS
jgi:hypothetical protein